MQTLGVTREFPWGRAGRRFKGEGPGGQKAVHTMVHGGRLVQIWAALVLPIAWPWVKAYRQEQREKEELRGKVSGFLTLATASADAVYEEAKSLRNAL